MTELANFYKQHEAVIGLIIMPFTYGFVGWFTNWLALKMTFYPIKFWGIPPFLGWQGIIPRKAHKMAAKSVDIITGRLLKIEEVFDKIDPVGIEKELKPLIEQMIEESTRDVIDQINPLLWEKMPDNLKKEIFKSARSQVPEAFKTIVSDIRINILQVL